MNFWIKFWSIFFFASLIIFACLAVVVTIGGFFNIQSLFKSLTRRDTSRAETCCDSATARREGTSRQASQRVCVPPMPRGILFGRGVPPGTSGLTENNGSK